MSAKPSAHHRERAQVARTESERHARRLRELTTQQQKLVQLYYRDAVSEDVLRAEQARITAEQAQVEQWAQSAQHQVDDVMAALDEALLLVDAHQRAYDLASESQRRFSTSPSSSTSRSTRQPTRSSSSPSSKPSTSNSWAAPMRCDPPRRWARESGRQTAASAQPRPAALAAPTGAETGPYATRTPAPLPGVGVRITNIWRRGRDSNPGSGVAACNGFRDRPAQPLRHLSEIPDGGVEGSGVWLRSAVRPGSLSPFVLTWYAHVDGQIGAGKRFSGKSDRRVALRSVGRADRCGTLSPWRC